MSEQYPVQQQPAYVVPAKSKFVAALLAFFLGTLGIHNFYLGFNGRGIIQLILGVIGYATSWILIGFVFLVPLGLWVIVELVLILFGKDRRSANGVPLA